MRERVLYGLGIFLAIVAALVTLVTIASALPSNQWWIRVWDFPRLIVFAVGLIALIGLVFLRLRYRWAVLAMLGLALLYQAWRIIPYTIFWPKEAGQLADADIDNPGDCFSVLSLNVLQDNRDYRRTETLIDRLDPDILLLMETDAAWVEAMEPAIARYPTRLSAPLPNKYGLLFATRLPLRGGGLANMTEPATPSIHLVLTTQSGEPFRLAGLHPRPPHPGQDTEERDAELVIAGRMIRASGLPAIAFGDFNDVGWSTTSQRFSRIGELVDPRIGRGFYATFPASWPAFRWPLDHLFFTEQFALRTMRVEQHVGSDHLPVYAELCLIPESGARLNEASEASGEDFEAIEATMESYREDQVMEASGEE